MNDLLCKCKIKMLNNRCMVELVQTHVLKLEASDDERHGFIFLLQCICLHSYAIGRLLRYVGSTWLVFLIRHLYLISGSLLFVGLM